MQPTRGGRVRRGRWATRSPSTSTVAMPTPSLGRWRSQLGVPRAGGRVRRVNSATKSPSTSTADSHRAIIRAEGAAATFRPGVLERGKLGAPRCLSACNPSPVALGCLDKAPETLVAAEQLLRSLEHKARDGLTGSHLDTADG